MSPSITKTLIKFRRRIGIPTTLPRNPSLPLTFPPFSSSSSFSSSERALCSLAESPLISSSQPQVKEGRRWSRWLLFLPGAITFGLGTWQIFRRHDKIEMLEHRRKRLELEPLLWNTLSSSSSSSLYGDLSSLEFRRVVFDGVFDESKSIYIGPRSRSISGVTENGYYVVTPLIPFADNRESLQSLILVNRGWVPRSWRDKSLENFQNSEQPSNIPSHDDKQGNEKEGSSWWRFWSKKPNNIKDQPLAIMPVKVIGVVRGSEKPSIFVPENDPSSGQWFYIDVPAIARACGLPENTIYIEDINENINPSKPYPIPKDINSLIRSSVMPQDHLNYTLTWYSLSAAVTFMAVKRLKPIKSRR